MKTPHARAVDQLMATPGPWAVRTKEFDDWGFVRSADGALVATARAGRYVEEAEYAEHRINKTDPFAANAHLIAAAPDLYAALSEAVQFIDPKGNPVAYQRCMDALNSARGDTNCPHCSGSRILHGCIKESCDCDNAGGYGCAPVACGECGEVEI